jgi:hypothetical protein
MNRFMLHGAMIGAVLMAGVARAETCLQFALKHPDAKACGTIVYGDNPGVYGYNDGVTSANVPVWALKQAPQYGPDDPVWALHSVCDPILHKVHFCIKEDKENGN